MEFRIYRIEIEPRNGVILPEHIPSILACSISEPSAFAPTSRGLTFTNEDYIPLDNHPVFIHLHTFGKQLPGNPPEQTEINGLVWALLTNAGINTSQVNVKVTYIDTMST